MKTVEVSNSYNVRRKQLIAELENAEKGLRGLLTRSVLNTDLSAITYEVLINSVLKIHEFDRVKIFDIEKRFHEAKKWASDYSNSINRIINNSKRKNLIQTFQNIENLVNQNPEHLPFLEQFYLNYFDICLSILEDTLIRLFNTDDNSMLFDEISNMLNDLLELHPIGGLTSMIRMISETRLQRKSAYDSEDWYISYNEYYSDIAFIWSQTAQLFIDYLITVENGGHVTLEHSNENLAERMKMLVKRYQGK